MPAMALLALAALGWFWWKGWLRADAGHRLALAGGGGLALLLLLRGQVVPGLALGVVVAALGLSGWMRRRVQALPADEMAARQLLGVGLSATRDEILSAHRRRIAEVHPDRTGATPGMAGSVNAARDLLLERLGAAG